VVTEIPTDQWDREPWVFEAAITEPDRRVRVEVKFIVHANQPDRIRGDCAELAQMTAKSGMDHITKLRKEFEEEPPF
jgi:hypothetical protein